MQHKLVQLLFVNRKGILAHSYFQCVTGIFLCPVPLAYMRQTGMSTDYNEKPDASIFESKDIEH